MQKIKPLSTFNDNFKCFNNNLPYTLMPEEQVPDQELKDLAAYGIFQSAFHLL